MKYQLSDLERRICDGIAVHYPFTFKQVMDVFARVKSIDQTLIILDQAAEEGIDPVGYSKGFRER